eukprot:scaffold285_cov330-Pavlova_lutheri.AAC.1
MRTPDGQGTKDPRIQTKNARRVGTKGPVLAWRGLRNPGADPCDGLRVRSTRSSTRASLDSKPRSFSRMHQAVLGGNASPTAKDLESILGAGERPRAMDEAEHESFSVDEDAMQVPSVAMRVLTRCWNDGLDPCSWRRSRFRSGAEAPVRARREGPRGGPFRRQRKACSGSRGRRRGSSCRRCRWCSCCGCRGGRRRRIRGGRGGDGLRSVRLNVHARMLSRAARRTWIEADQAGRGFVGDAPFLLLM